MGLGCSGPERSAILDKSETYTHLIPEIARTSQPALGAAKAVGHIRLPLHLLRPTEKNLFPALSKGRTPAVEEPQAMNL